MEKRISITPKEGLLKVSPKWRRKFAEESAEVLILEGRYSEMMTRISGITLADLIGESVADSLGKDIKRRKPKTVLPVAHPSNKLSTEPKPAPSPEQAPSTNQAPASVTDTAIEIDRDFETVNVNESTIKTEDSSKAQLGLNFE